MADEHTLADDLFAGESTVSDNVHVGPEPDDEQSEAGRKGGEAERRRRRSDEEEEEPRTLVDQIWSL